MLLESKSFFLYAWLLQFVSRGPRYKQEMEAYKAKKTAEAPEEEEGSDEESDSSLI